MISTIRDKVQALFEALLNHSGGVYVGAATATILFMAISEHVKGGWRAPVWFTDNAGVYVIILLVFAAHKPVKDISEGLREKLGKKVPE